MDQADDFPGSIPGGVSMVTGMHTTRWVFRGFSAVLLTAWLLLAAGYARAGQLDAATFFLIDTGMEESEVLIRAGPPDLLTSPGGETFAVTDGSFVSGSGGGAGFDTVRRAHPAAVRRWHYIPDASEHDPHLTVITMKSGRVFSVERTKLFSRRGLPEPSAIPGAGRRVLSDEEIVRRRLQRTLDAAERYARTRSRLKREDIELTRAAAGLPSLTAADTGDKVFRSVDDEGVVYYGDRPAGDPLPKVVDE
jgi:hypothetical protein